MKKIFAFLWEFIQIALIALIIIIPVRYYIIQPFFVKGISMEPTFQNGDYLIVDELSYRLRPPKRGEVVVFRFPENPKQFYIKRIIGLPGETIKVDSHEIYIFNKEHPQGFSLKENYLPPEPYLGEEKITLGPNSYFVMGDNRTHSFDSRAWGPVDKKYLVGRVLFRIWPFQHAMAFSAPEY